MKIRDRIQELRRVKAGQLRPHPNNWRTHPVAQQDALRGVLAEIGYADALVARQLADGSLELIDGHLRAEITPEVEVPVLVVDLDDQEAAKLLAVLDPLAGLAETNQDALAELLQAVQGESEALRTMLDEMAAEHKIGETRNETEIDRSYSRLANVEEWVEAGQFFECPETQREIVKQRGCVAVLFSGGKDSTAALLWAAKVFPDLRRVAIYVDTGLEFPGMGAHVALLCRLLETELEIVHPAKEWWSWTALRGKWTSVLYRECLGPFIHRPCARRVKELFHPDKVVLLSGSRAEEGISGRDKRQDSPLSSVGKEWAHYAPAYAAKKAVVEQVLQSSGVPLWEGYEQGFVRTACWCCPCQCGKQAYALNRNYPGLANALRRWEHRLGPVRATPGGDGATFDDLVARGERQLTRESR